MVPVVVIVPPVIPLFVANDVSVPIADVAIPAPKVPVDVVVTILVPDPAKFGIVNAPELTA